MSSPTLYQDFFVGDTLYTLLINPHHPLDPGHVLVSAIEKAIKLPLDSFLTFKIGDKELPLARGPDNKELVPARIHCNGKLSITITIHSEDPSPKPSIDTLDPASAIRQIVESSRGEFDLATGKVVVTLSVESTALKLYEAMMRDPNLVQIFELTMRWNQERVDFEALQEMISSSKIHTLKLDFCRSLGDLRLRSVLDRYDPIYELMAHPTLRSINLQRLPDNFFQGSIDFLTWLDHGYLEDLVLDLIILDSFSLEKLTGLLLSANNLKQLFLKADGNIAVKLLKAIEESRTETSAQLAVHVANVNYFLFVCTWVERSMVHLSIELWYGNELAELIRLFGSKLKALYSQGVDNQTAKGLALLAPPQEDDSFLQLTRLAIRGPLFGSEGSGYLADMMTRSRLKWFDFTIRDESYSKVLEKLRWDQLQALHIRNNCHDGVKPFLALLTSMTAATDALVAATASLSLSDNEMMVRPQRLMQLEELALRQPPQVLDLMPLRVLHEILAKVSLKRLVLGPRLLPKEWLILLGCSVVMDDKGDKEMTDLTMAQVKNRKGYNTADERLDFVASDKNRIKYGHGESHHDGDMFGRCAIDFSRLKHLSLYVGNLTSAEMLTVIEAILANSASNKSLRDVLLMGGTLDKFVREKIEGCRGVHIKRTDDGAWVDIEYDQQEE